MAALVCQLRKESHCVVYLPDCYEMTFCNVYPAYVLRGILEEMQVGRWRLRHS